MNITTVRNKLQELKVDAPVMFTWQHCCEVAIVCGISVVVPIDDSQDEAFAEFLAEIARNPEQFRLNAEVNALRMQRR